MIVDMGDETAGNPVPIVDTTTGNIILVITASHGGDTKESINNGTSTGGRYVFVFRSPDHDETWYWIAAPHSSIQLPGVRWFATGPGHGIQLTGEYAGRLIAPATFSGDQIGSELMYSDDGGFTWRLGAVMPIDPAISYRPSESMALELADGRVYVNSRNRGDHRAVSYIADGGEDLLSYSLDTTLIDPEVHGSVVRMTGQADGFVFNRVLFANPAVPNTDPDGSQDRKKMTVRMSYDETDSWPIAKLVHRGPSGYSDMVRIPSGRFDNPYVGLLYENGDDDYRDRISFARFDRIWLEAPQLMQLDFPRLDPNMSVPTGTTIFDSAGNGINGVLRGNGTFTIDGSSRYRDVAPTALWFSGDDDYIAVNDTVDHAFDFANEDSFTLEAVFGTLNHGSGGAAGSGPLIAKDVGPNSHSFWLRIEDGRLRFLVSDSVRVASVWPSVTVTDNVWHHVAAVRDAAANQLRLYVDGQLVGTATDDTTGSFANDNDLLIGAFNDSSPDYKRYRGYLNWARISMEALQPGDFF